MCGVFFSFERQNYRGKTEKCSICWFTAHMATIHYGQSWAGLGKELLLDFPYTGAQAHVPFSAAFQDH